MIPSDLAGDPRLLETMAGLLRIKTSDPRAAADGAAQLVAEALGADNVVVFLHQRGPDALDAVGTCDSPMAARLRELLVDCQPVLQGGTTAGAFLSGEPFLAGHLEATAGDVPGVVTLLGVHSELSVPLQYDGVRRGVLTAQSAKADFFSDADLAYLQAVSGWVAAAIDRTEFVEAAAERARQQGRGDAADEVFTVLAHDLGNLLAPLRLRLQLLALRSEAAGQVAELADVVAAGNSARRLQDLIDELLDARRLGEGLFTLRCEQLDLVPMAQQTAALFSTPRVPVVVQGEPAVGAFADPERLRRALENLVANAVRYAPEGTSVTVMVATEPGPEGDVAVVEVSDLGPGISPDIAPRIFDRYWSDGASKGLGLGLYLARGVIEQHGGSLDAASTTGEGARFRVAVPVARPRSSAGGSAAPQVAPEPLAQPAPLTLR
jgi:two-component system, OmpR family, sensor kinase